MTTILPFTPSYGINLSKEPQVRAVRLGDGYVQRTGRGINNNPKKYALKFNNRTDSEAERIMAFFDAMGGTTPFMMKVPSSDFSDVQAFFGLADGTRRQFQIQRTRIPDVVSNPNNPKFWPQSGEGFEPVTKLDSGPVVYKSVSGSVTQLTLGTDYTLSSTMNVTTTTTLASGTKLLYTGAGGNWAKYVATSWERSYDTYNGNTVSVSVEEDFS